MEKAPPYRLLFSSNLPEDMEEVARILGENDIAFKIEKTATPFDPTFAFQTQMGGIQAWVKARQYDEATELLKDRGYVAEVSEEAVSHFFADFSDEELLEVLANPKEWGRDQVQLAREVLEERGVTVEAEKVKTERQARVEEYRKPRKGIGLLIFAFLFGLAGGGLGLLLAGWVWLARGKDPAGKRYYMYEKRSRNIAAVLAVLCLAWFVITLIGLRSPDFFPEGFLLNF